MAGFELFVPVSRRSSGIKPGTASLARNGRLALSGRDLANLGITGPAAAVLIDRADCRLGVRAIRSAENNLDEPGVTLKWSKTRISASLNVAQALDLLGCDPELVAGRYELVIKDGTAIVHLASGLQQAQPKIPRKAKPIRARKTA